MKQNDFVKMRQSDWDQFAGLLKDPDEMKTQDLPKLYRRLSHDLAIAKSRSYSPRLVNQLNAMLLKGQQHLYQPANRLWSPLWQFLTHTWPHHLFQLRQYVIWAHVLFYGVALLSFAVTLIHPDFVRNVMSNLQVVSIEYMYDPTSEHYSKERASDGDFEMFGYYILNNISIAFQCFVGGVLLGFGALYFLLFNAIYFGAISGHIVNIGYSSTFFSFVITHGAFELTAIVLSAAAGGVVGMRLLSPGKLSRAAALKQAGRQAYPIIFGAFLWLIAAAFIEAFWSSSRMIPVEIKYTVGGLCWVWVLYYIFGRRDHADR